MGFTLEQPNVQVKTDMKNSDKIYVDIIEHLNCDLNEMLEHSYANSVTLVKELLHEEDEGYSSRSSIDDDSEFARSLKKTIDLSKINSNQNEMNSLIINKNQMDHLQHDNTSTISKNNNVLCSLLDTTQSFVFDCVENKPIISNNSQTSICSSVNVASNFAPYTNNEGPFPCEYVQTHNGTSYSVEPNVDIMSNDDHSSVDGIPSDSPYNDHIDVDDSGVKENELFPVSSIASQYRSDINDEPINQNGQISVDNCNTQYIIQDDVPPSAKFFPKSSSVLYLQQNFVDSTNTVLKNESLDNTTILYNSDKICKTLSAKSLLRPSLIPKVSPLVQVIPIAANNAGVKSSNCSSVQYVTALPMTTSKSFFKVGNSKNSLETVLLPTTISAGNLKSISNNESAQNSNLIFYQPATIKGLMKNGKLDSIGNNCFLQVIDSNICDNQNVNKTKTGRRNKKSSSYLQSVIPGNTLDKLMTPITTIAVSSPLSKSIASSNNHNPLRQPSLIKSSVRTLNGRINENKTLHVIKPDTINLKISSQKIEETFQDSIMNNYEVCEESERTSIGTLGSLSLQKGLMHLGSKNDKNEANQIQNSPVKIKVEGEDTYRDPFDVSLSYQDDSNLNSWLSGSMADDRSEVSCSSQETEDAILDLEEFDSDDSLSSKSFLDNVKVKSENNNSEIWQMNSDSLHPLIDHDYCTFTDFNAQIQSSIIATTDSKTKTDQKISKRLKSSSTKSFKLGNTILDKKINQSIIKTEMEYEIRNDFYPITIKQEKPEIKEKIVPRKHDRKKIKKEKKSSLNKRKYISRKEQENYVKIPGSFQNEFVYYATRNARKEPRKHPISELNVVQKFKNTDLNVFDWYKDLANKSDKSACFILGGSSDISKSSDVSNSDVSVKTEENLESMVSNDNSSSLSQDECLDTMAEKVRGMLMSMSEKDIEGLLGASIDDYSHSDSTENVSLPLTDLDEIQQNDLLAASEITNMNAIFSDINNGNKPVSDTNSNSEYNPVNTVNGGNVTPNEAVFDTSSYVPEIVTVNMYWNDLPGLQMSGKEYVRLVDIHKQVLPAKDTGILKRRCQMLGLNILHCTELQRDFLIRYANAAKTKSTVIVSKDSAKQLISYYVEPRSRLPKDLQEQPNSSSECGEEIDVSDLSHIRKPKRILPFQSLKKAKVHRRKKLKNGFDYDKHNGHISRSKSFKKSQTDFDLSPESSKRSERLKDKKVVKYAEMANGVVPGNEDDKDAKAKLSNLISQNALLKYVDNELNAYTLNSSEKTPQVKYVDNFNQNISAHVYANLTNSNHPSKDSNLPNSSTLLKSENNKSILTKHVPFKHSLKKSPKTLKKLVATHLYNKEVNPEHCYAVCPDDFSERQIPRDNDLPKRKELPKLKVQDNNSQKLIILHKDIDRSFSNKNCWQAGYVLFEEMKTADSDFIQCCTCLANMSMRAFHKHLHHQNNADELIQVTAAQSIALKNPHPSSSELKLWTQFQTRYKEVCCKSEQKKTKQKKIPLAPQSEKKINQQKPRKTSLYVNGESESVNTCSKSVSYPTHKKFVDNRPRSPQKRKELSHFLSRSPVHHIKEKHSISYLPSKYSENIDNELLESETLCNENIRHSTRKRKSKQLHPMESYVFNNANNANNDCKRPRLDSGRSRTNS